MSVSLVGHALCSISDVKLRMPAEQSDQTDALIARLINSFSTQAEQYTGRQFEIKSRTIFPDGMTNGGQPAADIILPAFPIDPDTPPDVRVDAERAFGSATVLTEDTDYVVDYANGIVRRICPNLLAENQPSYAYFGAILDRPRGMAADNPWDFGRKNIKIVWTGGITVPRPAAPATPSLAEDGSGSAHLKGTFRYCYSVINNTTGYESVASVEVPITINNKKIIVTFTNPGAGHAVRLYRSQEGYSAMYHLADVPGGATTTYLDDIADGSLDQSRNPESPGPVVVPDDLREAAMMQVTDWLGRAQDPGIIRVSQSGGGMPGGTATFRDKQAFIPYVRMVLDSYRP